MLFALGFVVDFFLSMKNVLFIIFAGVFWGLISIFLDNLQKIGFTTFQCVAIRISCASILLLIIILIKDKKLLEIKLKDLPIFFGMGLGCLGSSVFYLWDIEMVGSSAVPALLLDTSPIFVLIMSVIFLKEKITYIKVISLILTIAGVLLVTGIFNTKSAVNFIAVLIGLSAGISYAIYSIVNKRGIEKYNSLTLTFYAFLIASIIYVPFSGIFGNLGLLVDVKSVGFSLGLGVVSTVLPFVLYSLGLKKLPASKVSIFANIELVVAAIVGVLYFNDEFSLLKILGFVLVLTSIILLNVNFGSKNKSKRSCAEKTSKNISLQNNKQEI